MYAGAGNPVPPLNRTGSLTTRKVGILLRELSDDSDEDDADIHGRDAPTNLNDPWRADFKGYLHSRDELGAMTIVEWWGVWICPYYTYSILTTLSQWNSTRYPVWASLARDYLPVMASSVSSERAFSSAGITISKRRSRLKPDIVEALQFLKCLHRRELIYGEEPNASMISDSESQVKTAECDEGLGEAGGWDDLVGDLKDDEGFHDFDDEEVFVQSVA
jgi:hAT family C-terminal dimerisation region